MTDKIQTLRQLARLRRDTRWDGYSCIGDYHGGVYDCDFVSPYSNSAHNVDSPILILLQDWASAEVLGGPLLPERIEFGHDPRRNTNKRLRELLREHFNLEFEDVYATNVFPFVKPGGMGTVIPRRDLVKAAKQFALPQLEIIQPRLAVCLGKAAYNAIAIAADATPVPTLANAVATPFRYGETGVWCQPHPGRNSVAQVRVSWALMAAAYN